MGVMESMRSSSDSTFMQIVMVLVVLSFIGWYAVPQGDKASVVATVNGERIMDTEYRQLYSRVKAYREQQLGRSLTNAEEDGLGEQVRQMLIRNTVVKQQAEAIGLEVSRYEIDWAILQNGMYLEYVDDDGIRDEAKYQRFLSQRGLTEGAYEQQLIDQLVIKKMQDMIQSSTTISEPILQKLYEQSQRKVDITYVRLRPANFYEAIEVTDAELDTWLVENAEEAQETYDRDFERLYKHPEELEVSMIRLAIQEGQQAGDLLPKMNAIREQLQGGADFETLARRWSEHPSAEKGGNLGLKPVLKLSVEVTEAVKDLEVGTISRVIPSAKDLRIFKVHQRIEPSEDTFEDVKRDIARQAIRKDRAPTLAARFADEELLPAWKAAGSVPVDLITSKGLTSQSTGLVPVAAANPFGPPPELLSAAGDTPEGQVIDQVFENDQVWFVAQVTDRVEANLAEFQAQKNVIAGQELLRRREAVFDAWVTAAVADATVE